ncbi:MAG: VWA domain-containing protein [Blastocatellia bacterium]|nr:VWA domain-containing protein [Blastocatellia bacterium]
MRTKQPCTSFIIIVMLMVGMISPLSAQSGHRPAGASTAPAEEAIPQTRSASFTIPVTATDENGNSVGDLGKHDFHLYVDGVEQEITGFSPAGEPFQIALLIDTSRSTLTKLKDMREAAIGFVERLRPQDRVMVLSFDDQVYVESEMTDNRDEWRRAIRNTRVGRGTRIYDAIDLTITERLSRLEGRKAIVLLTDGVDIESRLATARSTIARAEAAGVPVYPIQYLSRLTPRTFYNQDLLRRDRDEQDRYFYLDIAERSGAEFHRADTVNDLKSVFRQIAEDLSHQYWLSYHPADVASDSKVKRIRVTIARRGVFAQARSGL